MFGSKAFNKFANNQVIVSWCAVEKLSGYITGLVTQQLVFQYIVFLKVNLRLNLLQTCLQ
jgi:hypothetical protein